MQIKPTAKFILMYLFLIEAHALYHALGADAESRQAGYRELFRYELDIVLVDEIRRATNSNYALGNGVKTCVK
jgi:hypothetical protein